MKKKFLAGILAAIFLLGGCSEDVQPSKPPVVKVQQVNASNAASEENYSGVVKGRCENF